MTTLDTILNYAYNIERMCEKLYAESAGRAKNERVKHLFEELSAIEKDHKVSLFIFAKDNSIYIEKKQIEDIECYFLETWQAMLEKRNLSTDFGDLEAVKTAYIIEHDLAEFYRIATQTTHCIDSKPLLIKLSTWAEVNERMLRNEYENLLNESIGAKDFLNDN